MFSNQIRENIARICVHSEEFATVCRIPQSDVSANAEWAEGAQRPGDTVDPVQEPQQLFRSIMTDLLVLVVAVLGVKA